MKGKDLRSFFNCDSLAVLPVIHVLDHNQTSRNIQLAQQQGVAGVFLINHDFTVETFLPIIRSIRTEYPDLWIGINFLAVTGKGAFPILAGLEQNGYRIDGYWADDARIDEQRAIDDQPEAAEILQVKLKCGWQGLYFGGTAFKKQRPVSEQDYYRCAEIASQWMDVVTTSGVATGKEPGTRKVDCFREAIGEAALALASGITPENINQYKHGLDAVLVATGINIADDFYHIDPTRLKRLMEQI